MSVEQRAADLFLDLPTPSTPHGPMLYARAAGKLLFCSGALPISDGKVQFRGRVGLEVTLDQARSAARLALLQLLASVRAYCGSLDKVRQVIHLTGQIASGAEWHEQEKVVDGASQLLVDLFGPAGQHSRTAVGVLALPQEACVQLELIVEIK